MTAYEIKDPNIDWDPAAGFLLCKALKREELAALYDRKGASNLSLPDRVGKASDSVGAGIVVRLGSQIDKPAMIEIHKLIATGGITRKVADELLDSDRVNVAIGDYVAWMPFTDHIIEIDGAKYSLVGYDKIRATRKGAKA